MGGAATVCIQYSTGQRDSYMAYNKATAEKRQWRKFAKEREIEL